MPAQQLLPDKRPQARVVGLPYNPSSQRLMSDGAMMPGAASDADLGYSYKPGHEEEESALRVGPGRHPSHHSHSPNFISRRQWCTVFILFFVNLMNYMDRLTIAGDYLDEEFLPVRRSRGAYWCIQGLFGKGSCFMSEKDTSYL